MNTKAEQLPLLHAKNHRFICLAVPHECKNWFMSLKPAGFYTTVCDFTPSVSYLLALGFMLGCACSHGESLGSGRPALCSITVTQSSSL